MVLLGSAGLTIPHGGGITIIPIGGITDGAMAPIGRAIRILGKDTAGG
jgi:hypothetical protein